MRRNTLVACGALLFLAALWMSWTTTSEVAAPPAAPEDSHSRFPTTPVPEVPHRIWPVPRSTGSLEADTAPSGAPAPAKVPKRSTSRADLIGFVPAKRRRKYSAADKPNSTVVAGYGDACFETLPRNASWRSNRGRDRSEGVGGQAQEDKCLGGYNDTAASRGIWQRRAAVLNTLDKEGWEIEVWYMAGRRGYLDVTSHYLKHMLRAFGGVAARVAWLYQEEQTYVAEYARKHYKELVDAALFVPVVRGNIRRMYRRSLNMPNTMVVKFDDDTAYIEPHALTAVFAELLHPRSRCVVVSGNVVNHVGLNPIHAYLGALNVSRSATASPRSVARHAMTYDGYQRNVLGSYQEPVEWRQAHIDLLATLRDTGGSPAAFYFPASHARREARSATAAAGNVFDFQCDGMWRRWGINFVAFPWLRDGHFGAMRDLGHLVKNKDEVYFSMEMGRHSAVQRRNHTCAVSDAVVVHFLNTGQASNVRHALGLNTQGVGQDPRVRDASLLAPALLGLYRDVARHYGGVQRCCHSTNCSLFTSAFDERPNDILPLP